jgi:hypothetical protein
MSQSVDGLTIHEEEGAGASAKDASTSHDTGMGLPETVNARRSDSFDDGPSGVLASLRRRKLAA